MKGTEIRRNILKFLREQEWPATTENVAAGAGVSWNTAQIHLLKLTAEGKVKFRRVGRQNQFWLSAKYAKEMAREPGLR
jgi:predicted ArsR family transcriptional regulator